MYPDGDRIPTKEMAIVECFTPQNVNDTCFECDLCNRLLSIPEGFSLGAISRELKNHLTECHPEKMSSINNPVTRLNLEERLFCSAQRPSQLPKKARFAKLTRQ
jgi:hypothetical protein